MHAQTLTKPDQLIFGPEWTFTNEKFLALEIFDKERSYILDDVLERFDSFCKKSGRCRFEKDINSGFLTYSDGLKITISLDEGVIEIQATPQSLAQWKAKKNMIQKNVFDVMAGENFYPHVREGAGHNNIGLDYFKDKPLLLRNFIVDFYNHPGVAVVLNSLVDNKEYAQSLDQMNLSSQKTFLKMLTRLDEKSDYATTDVLSTIGTTLIGKYLALGVRDAFRHDTPLKIAINANSRLEIRALRPQASMDDYVKVIEIFSARIHFLETINTAIPLTPISPLHDGYVALGQYADYVEQAGLKYDRYKSLMPPVWKDLSPTEFVREARSASHIIQCKKLFN